MRYILFFTILLLCLTLNTAHIFAVGLHHYSNKAAPEHATENTEEAQDEKLENQAEKPPIRKNRYHSVITLSDCLKMFGDGSTTLEFQKKYKHHYSKCMTMRRAAERKTMTVSDKTDTEKKTDTTKNTPADKIAPQTEQRPPHKNNGLNHWQRAKTTP